MIEWLNIVLLFVAMLTSLHFYVKSAQPAKLAQEIGPIAYEKCERYRIYASIPLFVLVVSYLLYVLYPIPLPFPQQFPWDFSITLLLALILGIPSFSLMFLGVRDAGEETLRPKEDHEMYGGIYNKIRHPQALGEVWTTHLIALILNSTFLFLISFLWIPVFYYMCVAEERDLVIRYGQEYIDYRERVRMFFPKIRKRSKEGK